MAATANRTSWADRAGSALTYDFCPWANRWVYWLKKPAASLGVAAALSLTCSLFVKPVALVGFAGVLLTLVLGYAWPSIALRRVRGELAFGDSRVREGEPATAILRVTNGWPWPIFGLSLERGFFRVGGTRPDSMTADSPVALDQIPGWGTTEFRWEFTPDSRGVYPLAVPQLATGFPFGLRRAVRPVHSFQRLIAWPRTFAIDTLLDADASARRDDLLSDQRVGDCGDLLGTRTYRAGDSLRRVHWAQTARHGRLIVCERQATMQTSIRIVVETASGVHSAAHADGSLEWSLRIAASLGEAYHAQHAHVECVVGDEVLAVAPGETGLRRFLDALAAWKEGGGPVPHQRRSSRSRRGALEIHVTTDAGLAREPKRPHPRDNERCIVLTRRAFEPSNGLELDAEEKPSVPLCAAHAWVAIDDPRAAVAQFRRQWRRMCSDG